MGALVHADCGGRAGLDLASPRSFVCQKYGERFPAEEAIDEGEA